MKRLALGFLALFAITLGTAPTQAGAAPIADVKAIWSNTNLPPGGDGLFTIEARNIGDADFGAGMTITNELPAGVTATGVRWTAQFLDFASDCTGVGTETVTCELSSLAADLAGLGDAPGVKYEGGGLGRGTGTIPQPSGYIPPIDIDVVIAPGASGTGTNTVTLEGGGLPQPATDVDQVHFDSTPAQFGFLPDTFGADVFSSANPFGEPVRQAGDRPFEMRIDFDLTTRTVAGSSGPASAPSGLLRTVELSVPRGLIGNPEAMPKCDPADFAVIGVVNNATACPSNTQLGYINVLVGSTAREGGLARSAIYNLEPPKGVPADFGFSLGGLVHTHVYPNVDPAQNYAVKAVTPDISNMVESIGAEATLWGVPGDPAHDFFRYQNDREEEEKVTDASFDGFSIRPFLTNPMDCGFDNGGFRIRAESYSQSGVFTPTEEDEHAVNVTGCDDLRFRFDPDISMQPTSRAAGGPTGLAVTLDIPQRDDEVKDADELYAENGDAQAIPTPPLKKAVVTLPQGMTVNPSAAQGLGACSPAQIGMGTDSSVTCPEASQFGTLTLKTPLLPVDEQPEGFIYVAKPFDNPFHSFLSLYLVIQEVDSGILVKIGGKADLDPQTGQITFTFDDLPQLPMEGATVSVKGGPRAGLVNPQTCGVKTIAADFYSWQDPTTPHHVTSNYEITHNPDGSPCYPNFSDRPFEPNLSGGTVNNLAGAFSPLEIALNRTDEDQELLGVEGTGPPGLLGSIKGVGRCSDAAIAAAANPERTGTEEIESPSCPSNSLVGTVDAGSGTGQVLTYVPGKIYLAGPYKGAPVSGVAIVPAVSGPFDLGTVVTRAPAFINPQTAELHVETDPLPQIFKGVPLRVRDIRVHLNRPNFTLNPTNCEPFSLSGTMFSTEGKSKNGGSRFQAADCASLAYKPILTTRLFGGTKRGAHPKFKGTYKGRPGDANTKAVVVTLPRSEFLDQSHIRTVCTRVQFAADACPPGSIYGHAEARTPLLDETLQGPVFLRSSNNKLPDLVAELHGIVDVEVAGRIDSIKGGIRASFESVPDVPVESFVISMQGGKKGLLVNSRDICARDYRIKAEFTAQNGKETTLKPKLQAKCGKGRKAKRAGARGR